jgi:hypothetical protein
MCLCAILNAPPMRIKHCAQYCAQCRRCTCARDEEKSNGPTCVCVAQAYCSRARTSCHFWHLATLDTMAKLGMRPGCLSKKLLAVLVPDPDKAACTSSQPQRSSSLKVGYVTWAMSTTTWHSGSCRAAGLKCQSGTHRRAAAGGNGRPGRMRRRRRSGSSTELSARGP